MENKGFLIPDDETYIHADSDQVTKAQLEQELEEAVREQGQFRNLAQRIQADFDNYRRRTSEELRNSLDNSNATLLLQVLPVLDDLQLALEADSKNQIHNGIEWLQGIKLIERKFVTILKEMNVEPMKPTGRTFDPSEHEVITYEQTLNRPDGEIVTVIREGYRLNNKLLRPAFVSVAKPPHR